MGISLCLLNIVGQRLRRAVLLTAIGWSDSKSDLLSPQLFEKIHLIDLRQVKYWRMSNLLHAYCVYETEHATLHENRAILE